MIFASQLDQGQLTLLDLGPGPLQVSAVKISPRGRKERQKGHLTLPTWALAAGYAYIEPGLAHFDYLLGHEESAA